MIVDWPTLQLYLVAAILLIFVPGPDMLLILGRSVGLGRRAGWITTLGTSAGNVVHATLAALGVAAVIAASPWLFDSLRLMGAGYLAWLGARSLAAAWRTCRQGEAAALPTTSALAWRQLFLTAFLTNLLNPKVVLFYLAFVPQFIDPPRGAVGAQTFVLGLMLAGMALIFHLGLASAAAGAARRLVQAPLIRGLLDALAGVVFIAFAIRVLLTERRVA